MLQEALRKGRLFWHEGRMDTTPDSLTPPSEVCQSFLNVAGYVVLQRYVQKDNYRKLNHVLYEHSYLRQLNSDQVQKSVPRS